MSKSTKGNKWTLWIFLAGIAWPLACISAFYFCVADQAACAYRISYYLIKTPIVFIWGFLLAIPLLAAALYFRKAEKYRVPLVIGCAGYCIAILVWSTIVVSRTSTLYSPDRCYENMTALKLGFVEYAADHDYRLPKADSWVDDIYPYIGDWKVFKCPADRSDARCSYAMNERVASQELDLSGKKPAILLYETSSPGLCPHGIGTDLCDPPRHISWRWEPKNWFLLTSMGMESGRPRPSGQETQW